MRVCLETNQIANDESEVALTILPLRCRLDQRAIRFLRTFFSGDNEDQPVRTDLHSIPPPILRMFRVRPFKLKVDYQPQGINVKALRDGAFIELINISPLDGMVLTLSQVDIENEIGFGAAFGVLVRRWIQEICSTQLSKFVTNTRTLEPFSNVGSSLADMVVLPWEAFQNGESMQKAVRGGFASLSNAIAYETFTMSSRAAEYAARQFGKASQSATPARPLSAPRDWSDTSLHAVESLSRGIQTANYKVVIVPYREYRRKGATGATVSVIKGIPVALAAPASGAAEALSFALLGARNRLRPDILKEEEASLRGLHLDS